MSDSQAAMVAAKPKRDRSPSFPFISLRTAIIRLGAFEEYFKRHPAPAKKAGLAWGMKGDSSQAGQTLAALKSFGLVDYQGSGQELQATLSEAGRTYLRAQQDSVKHEILARAALHPKVIAKYWQHWGADRPQDPICLDELVLKGAFNPAAAELFLKVYDDTIAYSGLEKSDTVSLIGQLDDEENEVPQSPQIKVGDYVQWVSNGVEQFTSPRKVVGIFPDGTHVQVFGSNTGIPMTELNVVDAPAPAPLKVPASKVDTGSAWGQGENELNVLQKGNRLQITADVDLEGIGELKEILGHYEAILKRLAARKSK